MTSHEHALQPRHTLLAALAVLALALLSYSGRVVAQDVPPAPSPPVPAPPPPEPAPPPPEPTPPPEPEVNTYLNTVLVSNGVIPAPTIDANLVNPWGMALAPDGPWWIANNATQTATVYNGIGRKLPDLANLPGGTNGPANPTGLVFSGGQDFVVSNGILTAPARFIFAGMNGTLIGWSPDVDPANAIVTYDDAEGGAVYTGLTLAFNGTANFLYAADFANNKVDVFDGTFQKVTLPGAFTDPSLPPDYAPFGIQAVLTSSGQTEIYVTYAQREPDTAEETPGAGLGIVNVFDTQGNLLRALIPAGGNLNAPWGVALAPGNFGIFGGLVLIGNFGDGTINAFDPNTGAFMDTLRDQAGQPIVIEGLWAIAFGNAQRQQPSNTLFYTAGAAGETAGVFGRIDPPRTIQVPLP